MLKAKNKKAISRLIDLLENISVDSLVKVVDVATKNIFTPENVEALGRGIGQGIKS